MTDRRREKDEDRTMGRVKSIDKRVPDDRQEGHYVEQSRKPASCKTRRADCLGHVRGRRKIGFPSDSLNRNFRHMAPRHPLLATIIIYLDILRVRGSEAKGCGPAYLGMLTIGDAIEEMNALLRA